MKIQSVVLVLAVALALGGTFYLHYSAQAHSDETGNAFTGWWKADAWVKVTIDDPANHPINFVAGPYAADVKVCVNNDWEKLQENIKTKVVAGNNGNIVVPAISRVTKGGGFWHRKEAHANLSDNGNNLYNKDDEYRDGCDECDEDEDEDEDDYGGSSS